MNRRRVFSEKKEAGKHIFRQNWWPMLIVFTLMLHITLPIKLTVAADPLSLVGKWIGKSGGPQLQLDGWRTRKWMHLLDLK